MTTDQARDFATRIDDDIAAEIETGLQGDFLDVPSRIDVRVGKAARDTRDGRLMVRLKRLDAGEPGDHQLGAATKPHVRMGHDASQGDLQVRLAETPVQEDRRTTAGFS